MPGRIAVRIGGDCYTMLEDDAKTNAEAARQNGIIQTKDEAAIVRTES